MSTATPASQKPPSPGSCLWVQSRQSLHCQTVPPPVYHCLDMATTSALASLGCILCTIVSGTENQLGAGSEGRTSMEGPSSCLSHETSTPHCQMSLLQGKRQMKLLTWEARGVDGDPLPFMVKSPGVTVTWEECLGSHSRASVPVLPLVLMHHLGNLKTEVLLQETQSTDEGSGSAD